MILVIGEILVDLIGEEASDFLDFKAKVGGAPLNVASNLTNLGVDSKFIGSIGNDFFGNYIEKEINKIENFKFELNKCKDYQTTIALFIKQKNNESKFQFLRKYGADYRFNFELLANELNKNPEIVHFGSLFLSSLETREKIFDLIDKMDKTTLKSFDVNIRSDIFEDEEYKDYYLEMIRRMDIVKFTEEEILYLSSKDTLKEALEYFSFLKILFVSLGKKGSLAYYQHKKYYQSTKEVEVKDSIGAGDSFFSGVLYKLSKQDINNLKEEDNYKILKFANACGAKTCMVDGAINGYKSYKEVEDYLNE